MRTQLLHSLLDALRAGLAAHREYERLISLGMGHDPALRAAVSQTSHCRSQCMGQIDATIGSRPVRRISALARSCASA